MEVDSCARLTLGAGFLFASAFNMRWALKSPNIYVQAYGAHALKDLPRVGAHVFAPLPWPRLGQIGTMIFLLAISPLGIGAGFPLSLVRPVG